MRLNYVLFAVAFLLMFDLPSLAQSESSLLVSVRDEQGAAIASARVKLSRIYVRFERQAVTDASGNFTFADLPTGNYRLSVEAKTFGAEGREFRFLRNNPISIDIVLRAAALAAEVSVTSTYLAGTSGSLYEIPGSIERIDARSLENARVFNFSEALRKVAGVNVRD
ncbi:MAG: carboxypeptidase regulatory-like domain-containing protein [Pyrinomonadaceae bacterium]